MNDKHLSFNPKWVKNHPSVDKVRELGNIFIELGKRPELKVDMDKPLVEPCGTIACHAGHFGIYLMNVDEKKFLELKLEREKELGTATSQAAFGGYLDGHTNNYAYSGGCMAYFLGVGTRAYDLIKWAKRNPEIWGNECGADIFSSSWAFDIRTEEVTLTQIGEHWLGVADRLEKHLGGTK